MPKNFKHPIQMDGVSFELVESYCDTAAGGTMLTFMLSMTSILVISFLFQCIHSKYQARFTRTSRGREIAPQERISHDNSPDLGDSFDEFSSIDQYFTCTGNDVPFHLVKLLSTELSIATRNYLEKMDCQIVDATTSQIFQARNDFHT